MGIVQPCLVRTAGESFNVPLYVCFTYLLLADTLLMV